MRNLLSLRSKLAKVSGTSGSSHYGVKLAAEPLELLQLPQARGEVSLDALEDYHVPKATRGAYLVVLLWVCLICLPVFLCELTVFSC